MYACWGVKYESIAFYREYRSHVGYTTHDLFSVVSRVV